MIKAGPMTRITIWIALSFFLVISAGGVGFAKANEDAKTLKASDPMEMLLDADAIQNNCPDRRLCEQASRTKEFGLWIEDYTHGNLKKAETDWGVVLAILKKVGCVDCDRLETIASQRTAFLDFKPGSTPLLKHLLSATEHKLGPEDRYTADCCMRLAEQLEGTGNYSTAIGYRLRHLSMVERELGKNSPQAKYARKWVKYDTSRLQTMKTSGQLGSPTKAN
jgi:hypothetical protein